MEIHLRRKTRTWLSQEERESDGERGRGDGSGAGDGPERGGGGVGAGRSGGRQGALGRVGGGRGREGGEVGGGGLDVGAVGHGHVDPELLALAAVARRAAGVVGAAGRGEVEDGVAVGELEHGGRQVARREGLRRHLQHRVLAGRVQEPCDGSYSISE